MGKHGLARQIAAFLKIFQFLARLTVISRLAVLIFWLEFWVAHVY